jgi:arylsulfatase A-like enzyme
VHLGTDQIVDFQKMPTFAQLLRGGGYRTSVTGKWQLATIEKHPGHLRQAGFDSWCVWQIWRAGAKTDRHWNATYNHDGVIRSDIADRFGPDVLVDYVIAQMREATAAGVPFFILHNELLPHEPIVATPDDRALGRQPSLGHLIQYMDKLVGRILDAVTELGIRETTYVIFTGDNGTYESDFNNPRAGEPGEGPHTRHTEAGRVNGGKWNLNDAGSHVPLIVWGPRSVPVGAVCDDLVDVVDFFPTFCELAGNPIPQAIAIDGRSIAPQIQGRPGVARAWVHQALSEALGGETLFDGHFRLLRKSGDLIDARDLPREKPADLSDPSAAAARARLQRVFDLLTPDGPRPPEPFGAPPR